MAPFAKLHEKLFRTSKQNNAESAPMKSKRSSIASRRSSTASRDSIGSLSKSKRGSYHIAHDSSADIFQNYDLNGDGFINPDEIIEALSEVLGYEVTHKHINMLLEEFDKDKNGKFDISEFAMMISYLQDHEDCLEDDFNYQLSLAVATSKQSTDEILAEISTKIRPLRNILCIQEKCNHITSIEDSLDTDADFTPAFAPSEMRCLALVSHNGMKKTMRDFVTAHKNILKKFRLTGTNSTMTMLREVFEGDKKVIYGPTCKSGPLGGDAELVALMCSGRLGGMLFFQDPMCAHPHQSDIECLCRQALVHNTMIANTPTSAYMMMHTFRSALENDGRPELIPSFFFSLQSPAVELYKAEQKKIVESYSHSAIRKKLGKPKKPKSFLCVP